MSSYKKKDSEAAGAQIHLKDLEAQVNSKDAALTTALLENKGLEAMLVELREQLQEVAIHLVPRFCSHTQTLVPVRP